FVLIHDKQDSRSGNLPFDLPRASREESTTGCLNRTSFAARYQARTRVLPSLILVGNAHTMGTMSIKLRKFVSIMLAVLCLGLASVSASDGPILAEIRFHPDGGAEKNAGVWVDGQYVGFVKELKGAKKLMLLPGKHEIVARQAWYKDYVEQAVLEPGEVHEIRLVLMRDSRTPSPDATGELKISATPTRAAVFIDDQFAGHVDEFDGVGKALLLTTGKHRVRIALPGYLPFETVADLRPHQKLKIQTDLVKGSITEAGSLVSKE